MVHGQGDEEHEQADDGEDEQVDDKEPGQVDIQEGWHKPHMTRDC